MDWKRKRAFSGRLFVLVPLLLCLIALAGLLAHHARTGTFHNNHKRRDISPLASSGKECRHVHHAADQCAFVRANCADEEAGLFSYLTFYYCRLGHAKPVAFFIIISWTATLFTTIGVAASEFFCINLSTISSILGLSESMAGVTFLAFGNGSPDVFSTFAAIKSDSGSLAVGELIGAAGFITAVVAGSMALVQDFTVPKKSFIRDVGFFIIAIAFSMSFLANGKLDIWECIVMVGFYGFYVLLVIVWHWRLGRRRRKREQQALARGNYVDAGNEGELDFEGEYQDDDDGTTQTRPHYCRHISSEDFNELERADQYLSPFPDLDDDVERDRWMGELSSNMRIRKPKPGERQSVYTPIRPSLAGALEFQAAISSIKKSQQDQSDPINLRRYSDDPSYTIPDQQKDGSVRSDPESAVGDNEGANNASGKASSRLAPNPMGRSRAVSANAADILRLSRYKKPRGIGSENALRQDPLRSHTLHEVADENQEEQSGPTPLLSISSPPSNQHSREPSPLRRRSRGSSQSLLVPPEGNRRSVETSANTSRDQAGVVNGLGLPSRPSLKITPPGENPPPLFTSPSEISVALHRSRSSSPRPSSLRLPPSSASDHSEFTNHLQERTRKRSCRWRLPSSPTIGAISRTLFPSLCGWFQKGIWEMILSVLLVPSFFLLTITLPVVEPEKSDETEQKSAQGSLPVPPNPNKSSQRISEEGISPSFTGFRDSTASIAVGTEQRHQHSTPPSSLPVPAADIPEHPHVAISADREWNRWLVLVQCFTAPYFIVLSVWANLSPDSPHTLLRLTLYSFGVSLLVFAFLLFTTTPTRPPRWHFLLCLLGFAVSIAWISSIANEVVGVLKAIGVICNMSDAILGLTIFAFGNSLGDLVADVQVARLGFPYMAFSACFGGPMLNILLGIGLSGIYIVLRHADERHSKHPDKEYGVKPYHVDINMTLLISAVALLVTLVGLLVAIPLNGWRMDRKIGIGLIVLWFITTTANVAVEVTGVAGDVT